MRPIDPADRMIWVSLPRATFGIVIRDGKVVDGAPYARGRGLWLVGMDERAAAEKLKRLGAEFVPLLPRTERDVSFRVQVDEISGDVYATAENTEPLRCTECGERIGLEAFSVGPGGDAMHDRCATAVS